MGGIRRTVAAAIVGGLLAGVAPAGAQAISTSRAVERVAVSGPVGTLGTVTAACPKGSTAVWGGWKSGSVGPLQGALAVYESRRIGTRGWRVSARRVISAGTNVLQVTAYCWEKSVPLKAVASVSRLSPNSTGSFNRRSTCRRKGRAVSGGFGISPGVAAPVVTGSFRVQTTSWETEILQQATNAGAVTVTTYTYCGLRAKRVLGEKARDITPNRHSPPDPAAFAVKTVTAGNRPYRPNSAGFRIRRLDGGGGDVFMIASTLLASGRSGTVGAFIHGDSTVRVQAFVYYR